MPKHTNAAALKLPDQLLARYFRQGELDHVASVEVKEGKIGVVLTFSKGARIDHWRDLGGGLGYVPISGD